MSKFMTYWSISSQVLKEEAELLGLQVEILVPEKNLFLVKGNGKEVLFKSTDFGVNSSLGKKICDDKELAHEFLQRLGIPIPKTSYINAEDFSQHDWMSFQGFRFPLIVKPTDEAHGNGVCMGILSIEELQRKLEASLVAHKRMIIQEQVFGDECRVLVVLGEVILALHRVPPCVWGDGKATICELITRENEGNPLRQQEYHAPLSHIKMDDELIDYVNKQEYTMESILPEGVQLQLRGNSNLGTGGTIQDVTSILHSDTKKLCVLLAEKLGLGICGVDVLTSDFSKPLSETGGVVLEVNSTPGIGGHRELASLNSGREMLKRIFAL